MLSKIPPSGLWEQVMELYIKSCTIDEIANQTGIHSSLVEEILRDSGNPENSIRLLDYTVIKLKKDGSDLQSFQEFMEPLRLLTSQGVRMDNAAQVTIGISKLCHKTPLDPDQLVETFKYYPKAAFRGVRTYSDLEQKASQEENVLASLVTEERELQNKLMSLRKELNSYV